MNITINASVIYTEEVKSEKMYWIRYKRKALKSETFRQYYGRCYLHYNDEYKTTQEKIIAKIVTILTDFNDIEYIRILDDDWKVIAKLDSDILQAFFEAYNKQYN